MTEQVEQAAGEISAKRLSHSDFAERLLHTVVTSERITAVVGHLVGERVEIGSVPVAWKGLVRAEVVGEAATVHERRRGR